MRKETLNSLMTKPTKWSVQPVKTQINLGIHPVWSESSLSAWRKLGSLATHWAHSEDSDQTGRSLRWAHMPLYWFSHEAAHIHVIIMEPCHEKRDLNVLQFVILQVCEAVFKMSCLMTIPTKWLCTQLRLRSAWALAQSAQSFRCALNG